MFLLVLSAEIHIFQMFPYTLIKNCGNEYFRLERKGACGLQILKTQDESWWLSIKDIIPSSLQDFYGTIFYNGENNIWLVIIGLVTFAIQECWQDRFGFIVPIQVLGFSNINFF